MEKTDGERDEARRLFSRPWAFVTSAPSARHLPPAGPLEIAFAGRSNVGKSTLINALCFQKSLARTSNTPGRTQALNFFIPEPGPDESAQLPSIAIVDMPGYGYAKAPKALVEAWTKLVFDYLRGRPTLKRVFLLIDSRHGVKRNDEDVMDLLDKAAVSYQIVLTKADKPGAEELSKRISATRQAISKRPAAHPQLLAVSAQKDRGLDDLREAIYSLTAEQNNG